MKTLKILSPAIITACVSLVTLYIYLFALGQNEWVRIFQICVAPLVALVIPLANRLFKINIPFAVNVVVTIHAIAAIDFGGGLDFYNKVPLYDKFLHTYFGFYGTLIASIVMYYVGGDKIKPVAFYIIVALVVLGLGCLWEIYEFCCDTFLGMDCQVWRAAQEDVEAGLTYADYISAIGNPLKDTIGDLSVTLLGSLIFYVVLFIDTHTTTKLHKAIYGSLAGE